jgi:hypothetical protein
MSAVLVVSSQQSRRRADILLTPRGDTGLHAGLPQIGKAEVPMQNHSVVLNKTNVVARTHKAGVRFSAERYFFSFYSTPQKDDIA